MMKTNTMYRLLIQNKSYKTGSIEDISKQAVEWSKIFTHIRIEPAA